MKEIYSSLPNKQPKDNPLIEKLYSEWLGGHNSEKARTMLHTQYHEVEKMTNALNIKW